MPNIGDVDQTLDVLARRLEAAHDPAIELSGLVCVAHDLIPQPVEVGVVGLCRDGSVRSLAGSSRLVFELDRVLMSLREGPWFGSGATGESTTSWSGLADRREAEAQRAHRLGLRAQLCRPLATDGRVRGWLDLYSTSRDDFTPETRLVAAAVAVHASRALDRRRVPSPRTGDRPGG